MAAAELIATIALTTLVAGGTAFYLLVVAAALRHRHAEEPPSRESPLRVSILKPLAGLEDDLEQMLETFFHIDYPDYEVIFGVHAQDDPAYEVARRMVDAHPERARLVVSGYPPDPVAQPNRKVHTLAQIEERASGRILVISDSDVTATLSYLAGVIAEFSDPKVGVTTCPYRALAGPSLWSQAEAVGANTEFWGGVLVAQMLAPMDFAVGPTMAVRRECLADIGGWEPLREYLAEDFVIGQRALEQGWRVELSQRVVDHHIGSQSFLENLRHRIRWCRSTRASRPWGYLAQIFTYPLPFGVVLVVASSGASWSWALLGLCAAARAAAAVAVAKGVLGMLLSLRFWAILPFQDLAAFAVWFAAFFGSTITWRGNTFRVLPGGKLQPME